MATTSTTTPKKAPASSGVFSFADTIAKATTGGISKAASAIGKATQAVKAKVDSLPKAPAKAASVTLPKAQKTGVGTSAALPAPIITPKITAPQQQPKQAPKQIFSAQPAKTVTATPDFAAASKRKEGGKLSDRSDKDKIINTIGSTAADLQWASWPGVNDEPKKATTWVGKKVESIFWAPKAAKAVDPELVQKAYGEIWARTPDEAASATKDYIAYWQDFRKLSDMWLQNREWRKNYALQDLDEKIKREEENQKTFTTSIGKNMSKSRLDTFRKQRAELLDQKDWLSLAENFRASNLSDRKVGLFVKGAADATTLGTWATPYIADLHAATMWESLSKFAGSVAGNVLDVELGAGVLKWVGGAAAIDSTASKLTNLAQKHFSKLNTAKAGETIKNIISTTMQLPAIFATEKQFENPDTWVDPSDRAGETKKALTEGVVFWSTMGAWKLVWKLWKTAVQQKLAEFTAIPSFSYITNRFRGMSNEEALEVAANVAVTHAIGSFDAADLPHDINPETHAHVQKTMAWFGQQMNEITQKQEFIDMADTVAKADALGETDVNAYNKKKIEQTMTQQHVVKNNPKLETALEAVGKLETPLKTTTGTPIIFDAKPLPDGTTSLVQDPMPTNPVVTQARTFYKPAPNEKVDPNYLINQWFDGINTDDGYIVFSREFLKPLSVSAKTPEQVVANLKPGEEPTQNADHFVWQRAILKNGNLATIDEIRPDWKYLVTERMIWKDGKWSHAMYQKNVVDPSTVNRVSTEAPIKAEDYLKYGKQVTLSNWHEAIIEKVSEDGEVKVAEITSEVGGQRIFTTNYVSIDDIKDLPDNVIRPDIWGAAAVGKVATLDDWSKVYLGKSYEDGYLAVAKRDGKQVLQKVPMDSIVSISSHATYDKNTPQRDNLFRKVYNDLLKKSSFKDADPVAMTRASEYDTTKLGEYRIEANPRKKSEFAATSVAKDAEGKLKDFYVSHNSDIPFFDHRHKAITESALGPLSRSYQAASSPEEVAVRTNPRYVEKVNVNIENPLKMTKSDYNQLKFDIMTWKETRQSAVSAFRSKWFDSIVVPGWKYPDTVYLFSPKKQTLHLTRTEFEKEVMPEAEKDIPTGTKSPDSEKTLDLVNSRLWETSLKAQVQPTPVPHVVSAVTKWVDLTKLPETAALIDDIHQADGLTYKVDDNGIMKPFWTDKKTKEGNLERFTRTWKQTFERFGNIFTKNKAYYELFTDKLASTSEALGRIHPFLKNDVRVYAEEAAKQKKQWAVALSALAEWFEMNRRNLGTFEEMVGTVKLWSKIADIYEWAKNGDEVLDLALKNGDWQAVEHLVWQDGAKAARTYLDMIHAQMKELGIPVWYTKDYFPRKVRDPKWLMAEYEKMFGGTDKIREFIKQNFKVEGKDEEVAEFISEYLLHPKGLSWQDLDLGNLKSRVIDAIPPSLNKYYENSFDALHNYVANVSESISMVKFLNEGIHHEWVPKDVYVQPTVDAYVMQKVAEGLIKPENAYKATEILNALFANPYTPKWLRFYKNATHLTTIGNTISAISQIEDLTNAIHENWLRAIPAYLKWLGQQVVKKTPLQLWSRLLKTTWKITHNELFKKWWMELHEYTGNLEKWWLKDHPDVRELLWEDINSVWMSEKVTDFVGKTMDLVGMSKMIRLAKQTFVNTTHDELKDWAKEKTWFWKRFRDRNRLSKDLDGYVTSLFYWDTARVERLKEDLRQWLVTDDVKSVIFNKVLDYDPSSSTEVPPAYNRSAAWRCFYMYKTFLTKRLELYRREIWNEFRDWNPRRATYNLARIALTLMLAWAATDEIKDFILGRPTGLWDRVIDQLFKMTWVFTKYSKYLLSKWLEENDLGGIMWWLQSMFWPPVWLIKTPLDDLKMWYDSKFDANAPQLDWSTAWSTNMIPVGGKFFNRYRWAYATYLEKKNKKRLEDDSFWARTTDELLLNSHRFWRMRGNTGTRVVKVMKVADGDTIWIYNPDYDAPGIEEHKDEVQKIIDKPGSISDKEAEVKALLGLKAGTPDIFLSIRYAWVDTPESAPGAKKEWKDMGVQYYGHEASAYNKSRVKAGSRVQIRKDPAGNAKASKSDRLMWYVETLPEFMQRAADIPGVAQAAFSVSNLARTTKVVNEELIARGYARYSKGFKMSEPTKYMALSILAESQHIWIWDRQAYWNYYQNLTGEDAASWKDMLDRVKEEWWFEHTQYDYMWWWKAILDSDKALEDQ